MENMQEEKIGLQDLMREEITLAYKPESQEVLEKENAIVHYSSTNDLDWGGDIVDPDGMDFKTFNLYQTVFFNHDYNRPIASSMWIKNDGYGLLCKTRFSKTNTFSLDIYGLHKENILRTWSIGFRPKIKNGKIVEGALEFDDKKGITRFNMTELLEYSSAPLAMNPHTLDQAKSVVKSIESKRFVDVFDVKNQVEQQLEEYKSAISEITELKSQLQELLSIKDSFSKLAELEASILELSQAIETKTNEIKIEAKAETLDQKKIDNIIKSVVGEVSRKAR